jgi:hypothetical protein
MTRRFLKALVPLAAVALTIMPIPAQAAPLDATSVYTALRGAAPLVTPPDAHGDSFGLNIDGGSVTGAFNGGATGTHTMEWRINYVVHTRTGIVKGTGTVVCDLCTVAGLTGTISFTVTESGHGTVVSCGPDCFFALRTVVGTWTISGATGALVGIRGSGRWTETFPIAAPLTRFLTGSILLSAGCDTTGNGSGNHQCEQ